MTDNNDKSQGAPFEVGPAHRNMYYSELIRIISVLYVGVLALMTFLLTVGFQRPHASFAWALYTSIVVLSLNLVFFVIGHMFHSDLKHQLSHPVKDEKETKKDSKSKVDVARRNLKVVRILQQALFVIAVLAVAWLALSTAHYFFNIPATPAAGTGQ